MKIYDDGAMKVFADSVQYFNKGITGNIEKTGSDRFSMGFFDKNGPMGMKVEFTGKMFQAVMDLFRK